MTDGKSDDKTTRDELRDRYGTINPALQMVVSEELEKEKNRLFDASKADEVSITANGGEQTATIRLEYDIEGEVGRQVFDLGKEADA